jgi:hypothetical protein
MVDVLDVQARGVAVSGKPRPVAEGVDPNESGRCNEEERDGANEQA